MVKAFVASVIASSVLFGGGLAAVACSSSSDSTFQPELPKSDAEDGPISSLIPDGGISDDGRVEAGPASCPPAIPQPFAPTWTAPTKKAACGPAELKAYYDACLADPGKTEGDGTCKKFKTDNAVCGACAEPDDKTGPIQWQLGRKFYTVNVAGCIAVSAMTTPDPAKCGEAYNSAVLCTRESCESCFAIGGTFDQFRDCQKAVQQTGICKGFETAQSTACNGYKNAGSAALACFNSGTETQEVHFTRVVGLLCGK